ncbi:MAG: alpha/beta fold hydrolase, partial [Pseudomonadota bacterium]
MSDGISLNMEVHETGGACWLIATHGIGEYLGRHDYLIKLFAGKFNILRYDLRGHGHSEGKRADIENFNRYMIDLDEILHFLKREYRMTKFGLFGHSMGGLITAAYLQNYAKDECYPDLVFINAPPAGVSGPLGTIAEMVPRMVWSKLATLPGFYLKGLVGLEYLSHDTRVKEAYLSDKLISLELSTRLLIGMMAMAKNVFSKEILPRCPAYCTAGAEDKVISVPTLREYFDKIERNFVYHEIPGAYHEIHL